MKNSMLIFLIGIVLNPIFTMAQEKAVPEPDTIYLRGGGFMVGNMLRYHPKRGVVLEKERGIYTTIAIASIRSISLNAEQKRSGKTKIKIPTQESYDFRETGIYFSTMGSMLNGIDAAGDTENGFGLQVTGGYMLHRLVGLGLGVGFDNYSVIHNNAPAVFPVSVEVRGYLTEQRRAPYYTLSAGYGFAAKDEERGINEAEGGVMLHPAFGLRLGAREDVNFAIDIGYRFQQVRLERDISTWRQEIQDQRILYKRFTLRFGIIF